MSDLVMRAAGAAGSVSVECLSWSVCERRSAKRVGRLGVAVVVPSLTC